ncbi:hypothetical protein D3C73_1332510 [compost metagenome]
MELVGELVGLGPQGIGDGAGGTEFAFERGQFGPVPQRGDGADVASVGTQGNAVHDH